MKTPHEPVLCASLTRHPHIDSWVRIDDAETVTVFTGKAELGQGIVNALAIIAADELDLGLDQIRVETADTARGHDEGYTAGSKSLEESGTALRQASAEARSYLLELAAKVLGIASSNLIVLRGVISSADSRDQTTYWSLLGGRLFNCRVAGRIRPKLPAEHRLVGRSLARIDHLGLVTGATRFVGDLIADGMLHARVVRPPSPAARLESVETAEVTAIPGVVAVVQDGSFLGVVARREEQAVRARELLRQTSCWRERASLPGDWAVTEWIRHQPTERVAIVRGTPAADCDVSPLTPSPDVRSLEATFSRPFQMHASIGPSAALAQWSHGTLEVWSHTQGVHALRDALADALSLSPDVVRVVHVVGPGCYGHNGADDAAFDAALLARAVPGAPVLLKWMRDDEHAWEPYGPPAVVTIRAGVDESGCIADWNLVTRSLTHDSRPSASTAGSGLLGSRHLGSPGPRPGAESSTATEAGSYRNATPPYSIRRQRIVADNVLEGPLRTSSMRSLGAYVNVFAIESIMDELAQIAGADPLEFRLRHLDDRRARDVLTTAALHAGWNDRRSENGRGLGIGYARYKNGAAYAAVVVDLRVDDLTAEVTLERAVIAADAGEVVDRLGLINQLEGGFVQSASWTLKEEVHFDRVRVTSADWDSYPILTFPEIPAIETILIDRPGSPFLGSGEATQGPTVAAIANAIAVAAGVRPYDLPFTPVRLRRAALWEKG